MHSRALQGYKGKITSELENERNPSKLADLLTKYGIVTIGVNPFPRLSFPESARAQMEHAEKYRENAHGLLKKEEVLKRVRFFYLVGGRGQKVIQELVPDEIQLIVQKNSHTYTLECGLFLDASGKPNKAHEDISLLLRSSIPKIPEAIFVFGYPETHVKIAKDSLERLLARLNLPFPVLRNKHFELKAQETWEII